MEKTSKTYTEYVYTNTELLKALGIEGKIYSIHEDITLMGENSVTIKVRE